MDARIILTDCGAAVLAFLQVNDKVWVGKDLGEATGIKGIYRVLTPLIADGLVDYDEPIEREFINSKGNTSKRSYKTYKLTDAGRAYDCGDNNNN